MAATKTSKSPEILSIFMDSVLEHEKFPLSVYKFCKTNEIDEQDFYKSYASLDTIKYHVWQVFFDNTMGLLHKNKQYDSMDRKDRLLTFYFTFFEVLLLNRSYVLFALEGNESRMTKIGQLKKLRISFKSFASELIEEGNDNKTLSLAKHPVGLFSEASWAQLLFFLKFWLDDTSPNFEKTDAAIEKSINVAFDNTQLDAIFDLGKFLWKEKFI